MDFRTAGRARPGKGVLMNYVNRVATAQAFDETLAAVLAGLSEQGFGVLTQIDMQATMKAKLDADMDRCLILGACNPTLAWRALQSEPAIGALLPCNIVVRSDGPDSTIVEAVNPAMLVDLTGNHELQAVSDEVANRLGLVLHGLAHPAAAGRDTP
jgi:uncharacterized protein (DUF302 family)